MHILEHIWTFCLGLSCILCNLIPEQLLHEHVPHPEHVFSRHLFSVFLLGLVFCCYQELRSSMFLPVERKFKDIAKVLHTLKEKIFMDSVVRQIPVGKFHEFWDRGGSYYMYYFNYPTHLQTIRNKTPANEKFLFCSIQPLYIYRVSAFHCPAKDQAKCTDVRVGVLVSADFEYCKTVWRIGLPNSQYM